LIGTSLCWAIEQTPYFKSAQEAIEWAQNEIRIINNNLESDIELDIKSWSIENFDKLYEVNTAIIFVEIKNDTDSTLLKTIPYHGLIQLFSRINLSDLLDLQMYSEACFEGFDKFKQHIIAHNKPIQKIINAIKTKKYTFANIDFNARPSAKKHTYFASIEKAQDWMDSWEDKLEYLIDTDPTLVEQLWIDNHDKLKEASLSAKIFSYGPLNIDSLLTKPYVQSLNLTWPLNFKSILYWTIYLACSKQNQPELQKIIKEKCPTIRPLIDLHKKTEKIWQIK